jgi:hypothetical protein
LDCAVSLSTDGKRTWKDCGKFKDGIDLTDLVKGQRHYLLRLHAGAPQLRNSGLTMTTVCQVNSSILPRLKDGGTEVAFQASRRAVASAGTNLNHAETYVIAGKFGSPTVSLQVGSPRKEPVLAVHAAAHLLSGNPPNLDIRYQIEVSTDSGKSWKPLVKDWTIPRQGHEPGDFWSQSFCWGSGELKDRTAQGVQVRFSNSGGKAYARAEVHVVYQAAGTDATQVTYSWSDERGPHRASHVFAEDTRGQAKTWTVPTGTGTQTHWVELEPVPGP